MGRIKVVLPATFSFSCILPIRITDINYGGHAGNDSIFSLIHEARMQWLRSLGYTELSFDGHGLIMADAAIEYKAELFYDDRVKVSVAASDFSRTGFDLSYLLELVDQNGSSLKTIAVAKTGMVCFDYTSGKIMSLSQETRKKLEK